jgi:transposase InsO family protein
MGEKRGVTASHGSRCRTGTPHSGDSNQASWPIWESASTQGAASGVWEKGKFEESSPFDEGKQPDAKRRGKFIPTTDSRHAFPVCENILSREFHAQKSGMKWVSDITSVRTVNGWVYSTVVLDLYDRKVIGWALSADMEASHTAIVALEMAVRHRPHRDGLIFYSDRGVQYCAQFFRRILRERCSGVRQSMSRKGNCWDNAWAESFFKTLKTEVETVDGKRSENDVRQSVFFYIEAYYNRDRMHSAPDYDAPNVFYLGKVA